MRQPTSVPDQWTDLNSIIPRWWCRQAPCCHSASESRDLARRYREEDGDPVSRSDLPYDCSTYTNSRHVLGAAYTPGILGTTEATLRKARQEIVAAAVAQQQTQPQPIAQHTRTAVQATVPAPALVQVQVKVQAPAQSLSAASVPPSTQLLHPPTQRAQAPAQTAHLPLQARAKVSFQRPRASRGPASEPRRVQALLSTPMQQLPTHSPIPAVPVIPAAHSARPSLLFIATNPEAPATREQEARSTALWSMLNPGRSVPATGSNSWHQQVVYIAADLEARRQVMDSLRLNEEAREEVDDEVEAVLDELRMFGQVRPPFQRQGQIERPEEEQGRSWRNLTSV